MASARLRQQMGFDDDSVHTESESGSEDAMELPGMGAGGVVPPGRLRPAAAATGQPPIAARQRPLGGDTDTSTGSEFEIENDAEEVEVPEDANFRSPERPSLESGSDEEGSSIEQPAPPPADLNEIVQRGQPYEESQFTQVLIVNMGEEDEPAPVIAKIINIPLPLEVSEETKVLYEQALADVTQRYLETRALLNAYPFVRLPIHVIPADGCRMVTMCPMQPGVCLTDVSALIKDIEEAEVQAIMVTVLTHLAKLHNEDIVHGNLKTSNIICGTDGSVSFTDCDGVATFPTLSDDFSFLSPDYAQFMLMLGEESADDAEKWLAWYEQPYSPTTRDDMFAVAAACVELAEGCPRFFGLSLAEAANAAALTGDSLHVQDALGWSDEFFAFVQKLSQYSYASEALNHPWLRDVDRNSVPSIIADVVARGTEMVNDFVQDNPGRSNLRMLRNSVFSKVVRPGSSVLPKKPRENLTDGATITDTGVAVVNQADVRCLFMQVPKHGVVQILNVMGGEVHVLDWSTVLIADNIQDLVMCTGPCGLAIIRNAQRCQLSIAARTLLLDNCSDCVINTHLTEAPVVKNPASIHNCVIQPYAFAYRGLSRHWAVVDLPDISINTLVKHMENFEPISPALDENACDFPFAVPVSSTVVISDPANVFIYPPEAPNKTIRIQNINGPYSIVLLSALTSVSVADCEGITVICGPTTKPAAVSRCKDCTFHFMAPMVAMEDSTGCELRCFVLNPILTQGCQDISVGPWCVAFPQLPEVVGAAWGATVEELPENAYADVKTNDENDGSIRVETIQQVELVRIGIPNYPEPSTDMIIDAPAGRRFADFSLSPSDPMLFIGVTDSECLRSEGMVDGRDVIIKECTTSSIVINDHVGTLRIENCIGPLRVVATAVANIEVKKCKFVKVFAACQTFVVEDSVACEAHLHVNTQPQIHRSRRIALHPLAMKMPNFSDLLTTAGIKANTNRIQGATCGSHEGHDTASCPYLDPPFHLLPPLEFFCESMFEDEAACECPKAIEIGVDRYRNMIKPRRYDDMLNAAEEYIATGQQLETPTQAAAIAPGFDAPMSSGSLVAAAPPKPMTPKQSVASINASSKASSSTPSSPTVDGAARTFESSPQKSDAASAVSSAVPSPTKGAASATTSNAPSPSKAAAADTQAMPPPPSLDPYSLGQGGKHTPLKQSPSQSQSAASSARKGGSAAGSAPVSATKSVNPFDIESDGSSVSEGSDAGLPGLADEEGDALPGLAGDAREPAQQQQVRPVTAMGSMMAGADTSSEDEPATSHEPTPAKGKAPSSRATNSARTSAEPSPAKHQQEEGTGSAAASAQSSPRRSGKGSAASSPQATSAPSSPPKPFVPPTEEEDSEVEVEEEFDVEVEETTEDVVGETTEEVGIVSTDVLRTHVDPMAPLPAVPSPTADAPATPTRSSTHSSPRRDGDAGAEDTAVLSPPRHLDPMVGSNTSTPSKDRQGSSRGSSRQLSPTKPKGEPSPQSPVRPESRDVSAFRDDNSAPASQPERPSVASSAPRGASAARHEAVLEALSVEGRETFRTLDAETKALEDRSRQLQSQLMSLRRTIASRSQQA